MRGGKEGETRREAVACCQLGITTLAGMKCGVVFRRTTFVSLSRPCRRMCSFSPRCAPEVSVIRGMSS